MTQYSSREPFNDDPKPYVTYVDDRRTEVRSKEWDIQSDGGTEYVRVHDPRPEFDRPQTNPTNRMLTRARRAYEDGYLDAFCEGFLEQRNTEHPEIDHAQRVLTRLANLKGER